MICTSTYLYLNRCDALHRHAEKQETSKPIADASFFELKRQLGYKSALTQSQLVVISRFFPSSKTCSRCKQIQQELTLADRLFQCKKCGLQIDRDLNASFNIQEEGLKQIGWATPDSKPVDTRKTWRHQMTQSEVEEAGKNV